MYLAGDAWACCDRCGLDYRRSGVRKEWTGLIVCAECLDPRPAELDPPNLWPEGLPLPDARPEPDGSDTNTTTRSDL
jgi:hypothetical protein